MASHRAPLEIYVRCDIGERCGYTGTMMVPHNFYATLNVAFDTCPHCGQFTLKQYESRQEKMAGILQDSLENDDLSTFMRRWRGAQ